MEPYLKDTETGLEGLEGLEDLKGLESLVSVGERSDLSVYSVVKRWGVARQIWFYN